MNKKTLVITLGLALIASGMGDAFAAIVKPSNNTFRLKFDYKLLRVPCLEQMEGYICTLPLEQKLIIDSDNSEEGNFEELNKAIF
jgi:hypothetical protein